MTKPQTKSKKPPIQTDLLIDLINAFALLKTPTAAALFIQDIMTLNEIQKLSRRLRIAKLLLQGKTYDEIADQLQCSQNTISKVQTWLNLQGEGLKQVIRQLPDRYPKNIQRTIFTYYGPDPLTKVSSIINKYLSAKDRRQAQKLLNNAKIKQQITQEIDQVFRKYFKKLK